MIAESPAAAARLAELLRPRPRTAAPADDDQVLAAAKCAIKAGHRLLELVDGFGPSEAELEAIVDDLARATNAALDWKTRHDDDEALLFSVTVRWTD